MTQNALVTLTKGTQLSEVDLLMMQEAGQEAAAFDFVPTRLKIAPGGTNVFQTGDGDVMKSFNAIVLMSQKARAYWPSTGSGLPPMCSSPDGSLGYFTPDPNDDQFRAAASVATPHPAIVLLTDNATMPDHFYCNRCPMSQWGSNHQRAGSRAQACKALRRLAIMVDGWTSPAILTLPPSSTKIWDTYCSVLGRTNKVYFGVRTTFALEAVKSSQGDPYSIVSLKVGGELSNEEKMAVLEVRRQYGEMIRDMPIADDDYEAGDGSADDGSKIVPF